jgi:fructose-1,6-bisphosphatase-3
MQKAIDEGVDILSSTIVLEKSSNRKRVIDTDVGLEIKEQIKDLDLLLSAYRKGIIKEQR